jgi:hypothetical protein
MENGPNSRIHTHHHAVQFYGNDDSLFTTVGGFISEGLVAGQPAVIIATESHRAAIVEQLTTRLIDVQEAERIGDLVLVDAHEALATFMIESGPDAEAFERHVGGVMEKILNGRPRTVVRAYGEMVDVLWKEGRTDAAIKLEILWNKLATAYQFALLCGYSMGNFYKQAEQFQEVCRQHTHVLDTDTNVVVFDAKRAVKTA